MLTDTSAALAEALKRCDKEPIQYIGSIQSHGVLVAVDSGGVVRIVSENIQRVFGVPAPQVLNQPARHVFGSEGWASILALPLAELQRQPLPLTLEISFGRNRVAHEAQVHRVDESFVIEIEAGEAFSKFAQPIDFDSTNRLVNALLAEEEGLLGYASVIANQVQKLTGFDRVMVYQFDPQWNGKIIAECRNEGIASFLGNHFPASDIPPPARKLYSKNLVRILVDRDDPAVPLIHSTDLPIGNSLDLSFSVLRSIAPIHLQYLRNLGVRASLTVSLLQNGRLWGLIACHHEQPRQLSFKLRQAMELVARAVSTRLTAMAFIESSRYHAKVRNMLPRLVGVVKGTADASIMAPDVQQEVLSLVQASGAVIATGTLFSEIGATPTQEQLQLLLNWVRPYLSEKKIFATHGLAIGYPAAAEFSAIASGLLAIRLDDCGDQLLLWFREEAVRSIPWAGEAAKYLVEDDRGPKLEPRRSFSRWVETKRGESAPWSDVEIDAASTLSITLAEIFARQQLRAAEESSRLAASVYENSSEGILVTDAENVIIAVNPAFSALTGYSSSEAIGQTPALLKSGIHNPTFYEAIWQSLNATGVWSGEILNRHKSGEIYPEWLTINTIHDQAGKPHRRVGLFTDISERKRADADLRIAAIAFESQEGMVITDRNGLILRVNKAFSEITGYSANDAVGKNSRLLNSGRHGSAFYAEMWATIHRSGVWQGEIWNRRKSGEVFPEWLSIAAVKSDEGNVTHYVGTFSDISQRKMAEDEIKHLAFYDHLTQLPNRRLMMDRLGHALTNSARHGRQGAVMLIDLDNFKSLNDSYGHGVGDQLLVQVASRLSACVRVGDTVARFGGDEFVVILEGLDGGTQAPVQAKSVAVKIQESLGAAYDLDISGAGEHRSGRKHHCTSSTGITLFRDFSVSAEELLKRADTAMYQAKAAGRDTLVFFDPEMQASVKARAALEFDLRKALEEGQFLLHYQPQVDRSGRVTGAEALVRWKHPDRGLVAPSDFIPLAEDTGLILPLGHWVMSTACKQLRAWALTEDSAHLTLAVNVSARQFAMPDFVQRVLDLIEQTGARPDRLKLELTESLLLENANEIIAKMLALKSRGVTFSLDDFGTGYSSLSYLKRLPLDQLKIDQSFVRDILVDTNDAAIARTVVALGESLGLSVIAEGVETEMQRDFLAKNGCLAYQGYFYSRPLPIEDFNTYVGHSTAGK